MENVIYGFDILDLIYEGFYVLWNKRKLFFEIGIILLF